MAAHASGHKLKVVDLFRTILVNLLKSLLELCNLIIIQVKSLAQPSFYIWICIIDLTALVLVQKLKLFRHILQLIRLYLHC